MPEYYIPLSLLEKSDRLPDEEQTDKILQILRDILLSDECRSVTLSGVGIGFAVYRAEMSSVQAAERALQKEYGLRRRLSASKLKVYAKSGMLFIDVPVAVKDYRLYYALISARQEARAHIPVGGLISGDCVEHDFTRAHLAVAGGDRDIVYALINAILYKNEPRDARLIIFDGMVLALDACAKLPHRLLDKTLLTQEDAFEALELLALEIKRRGELISCAHKGSFDEYNKTAEQKLPRVFVMFSNCGGLLELEGFGGGIAGLAPLARIVGIHFIVHVAAEDAEKSGEKLLNALGGRLAIAGLTPDALKTFFGENVVPPEADCALYSAAGEAPQSIYYSRSSQEEGVAIANYLARNYESIPIRNPYGIVPPDVLAAPVLEHIVMLGSVSIAEIQSAFNIGFFRASRITRYLKECGYIDEPNKLVPLVAAEELAGIEARLSGYANYELMPLDRLLKKVELEGKRWCAKLNENNDD